MTDCLGLTMSTGDEKHVCVRLIRHCIIEVCSHAQFSVPQIEYTLGGTSKKGSHVYFLLIVAMVLLL